MHILFAGGGTAGHINPALSVAEYIKLQNPNAKISYIGARGKLEETLVPQNGYDFYPISVAGFQRKLTPKNIAKNCDAAIKAVTSSIEARKLLKELKPDIVMGTGGYVSGPVVRQAYKMGIKTCIHEQNAFPGVTTKMLAENVDAVMLAMEGAKKYLNLKAEPYITGNPVRPELMGVSKQEARKRLNLGDKPLLLSFGGSLGARPINEAVSGLIRHYANEDKFYHIHATGRIGSRAFCDSLKDITIPKNVFIREYIDDMDICLAAADLVICRAGAITLSELQVCGKPAILIPSPYVAENHQYHNAKALSDSGAAIIIEEKDLTTEGLINTVGELLFNNEKLTEMAQNAKNYGVDDANKRIYDIIMNLYSGG